MLVLPGFGLSVFVLGTFCVRPVGVAEGFIGVKADDVLELGVQTNEAGSQDQGSRFLVGGPGDLVSSISRVISALNGVTPTKTRLRNRLTQSPGPPSRRKVYRS